MKIEAFFSGIKNANEAVEKLKSAGYDKALADINDHYVEFNNGVQPRFPGTENATNLSALVLSSGEHIEDPSKKPLDAASPMVSGMGGFEEITDVNYKVIVNVDSNNVEDAKQILRNMGGDLRDPNLDLPHRLKDINPKLGDLDF